MVAWGWLSEAALAFWIGILVIECFVLQGQKQLSDLLTFSRKQTQPLQWLCLSVLLVAEIITLILRVAQTAQSLNGDVFDLPTLNLLLFHSTYGFLWIAQIILILGSLWLLWWTTRRQKWPLTFVCLILAALISIAYVLSVDAAQQPSQLDLYFIVLNWFSLVALSIWIGGLTYTGYILLALLPVIEPELRKRTLTVFLRRFSALVLVAICVLIVSELYLTMISVSNSQLFTSEYERVLLVKWILILIMVLCSAYVFIVLRPKLIRQTVRLPANNLEVSMSQGRQSTQGQIPESFRLALRIQSWLGAIVLLCAALMAFFMSPIITAHMSDSQNVTTGTPSSFLSTQTKQVDGLSVMLAVVPAKIDAINTVEVQITDTASGKPVTNARVVINTIMDQMDMGKQQQIMTGGTPTYSTTFTRGIPFSMTGYWDIILTITLPNRSPLVVPFMIWFTL